MARAKKADPQAPTVASPDAIEFSPCARCNARTPTEDLTPYTYPNKHDLTEELCATCGALTVATHPDVIVGGNGAPRRRSTRAAKAPAEDDPPADDPPEDDPTAAAEDSTSTDDDPE